MSLLRAIPLFLNSGIFAAIWYGYSGNFAAIVEKWLPGYVLPGIYQRQLFVESSPLRAVTQLCVFYFGRGVWPRRSLAFPNDTTAVLVLFLCSASIETLRFLPTAFTETYVYAARPSDARISIVTAYLRCDNNLTRTETQASTTHRRSEVTQISFFLSGGSCVVRSCITNNSGFCQVRETA